MVSNDLVTSVPARMEVANDQSPLPVKPAAETIRDLQCFFDDLKINSIALAFIVNYCHDTPFFKAGFLDNNGKVSFPAIVWYDEKPLSASKDLANDLTILYPGEPDSCGVETIQCYSWLSFMKMVMRHGYKPDDFVVLVPPKDRGSDKLIRARIEVSVGTQCKSNMALDYAYWAYL